MIEDQSIVGGEEHRTRAPVGVLLASDPDLGDTLRFAATGGDGAGLFDAWRRMARSRWWLSAVLDFESVPDVLARVEVTDAGGLTAAAVLDIDITDIQRSAHDRVAEPDRGGGEHPGRRTAIRALSTFVG
ncbi:MAG: cadherin repeat domain-containing protein [Ilumatobacteraceae bacterium]